VPTALPCGHVMCLVCARRPTLTPATSMSVCHTCHVPYTRRDICALNLREYYDDGDRKYSAISYPANEAQANGVQSRLAQGLGDSPFSSETSQEANEAYGMTVPALLQRIRDLEVAVSHRDSQIREWRKQFDKNAQALLIQLRDVRDLKQEVMDWWRRFREKDLEVQNLKRALKNKPPTAVQVSPTSLSHKRGLDGSRLVTHAKIEVPQNMRRNALAPA